MKSSKRLKPSKRAPGSPLSEVITVRIVADPQLDGAHVQGLGQHHREGELVVHADHGVGRGPVQDRVRGGEGGSADDEARDEVENALRMVASPGPPLGPT